MVYTVPPGKLDAIGLRKRRDPQTVLTLPQLVQLWVEDNQTCKVCHQYVGTSCMWMLSSLQFRLIRNNEIIFAPMKGSSYATSSG